MTVSAAKARLYSDSASSILCCSNRALARLLNARASSGSVSPCRSRIVMMRRKSDSAAAARPCSACDAPSVASAVEDLLMLGPQRLFEHRHPDPDERVGNDAPPHKPLGSDRSPS